ncbi:hypothetical protein AMECASPLE_035889 [Ameca splendens]|uniref:Uncharacterized protein n=1 Tax=Ameca splendens TaxID=208324 RepID=A0ABV1A4Z8_9TELE
MRCQYLELESGRNMFDVDTPHGFCERSGRFACYPCLGARSGAARCEGDGGRGVEGSPSEVGAERERWMS